MARVKKIKTLEGFSNATDVDVIDRAAAVHTGMTAYSGASHPLIPGEVIHPFRTKSSSDSD